jgi:uncharacterized membrane protein
MSASITHPSMPLASASRPWRFGVVAASGEASMQWLLKRNCSASPRQMLAFFSATCLLSLAIAVFFWVQGATLVMPFAWLEMAAVGAALLVYARHAADSERIRLRPGSLCIEHMCGGRLERVEFAPAWVRVEPEHGERSLIELSGQGRRIAVGRFVRPELRRQLADELRCALRLRQWAAGAPGAAVTAEESPDKSEN